MSLADLRARKRAAIIDLWLPRIVDEALSSHEIPDGIDQAGLDRADLSRRIREARDDVIAPADALLESVVNGAVLQPGILLENTPAARERGTWSVLAIVSFTASGLILTLLYQDNLPWWGLVLGLVLALALGLGSNADGLPFYRNFRPGVSPGAASAFARWWEVCRDEGVLPFVRRVLDGHLAPPTSRFVLSINADDAPGLRGTSELSYVVRTGSVKDFLSRVEQLPTGAIGLAGPRGVGKSSIIDYFVGRVTNDNEARPVKVTVSAPVHYEPKEFVLHLFAAVCHAVLRARDLAGVAPSVFLSEPNEWRRWLLWRRYVRNRVVGLAHQHLQNIHYLQIRTTGWAGQVALPLTSQAGWSRSTQRERRPQTYPELVGALREFLGVFAAQEGVVPAMIIAIDELDKIESADRAQQFLNEIKAIFDAPGTQFIISVSEDALASFERGSLQVRDAFDSAFHEIVRVNYLTLADTADLISSRVLRLPEPFKWLVHCMSGGLPRDVVRIARAMFAFAGEPPPSLDDVCRGLVADDLARKAHAFQLDCRGIGDSPEITHFLQALSELSDDPTSLRGLMPLLRQEGELAALSLRVAAYVYYSATLLEVFRHDRVDSRDKDTFDLLGRAKQSLAVHPRLAWLRIDEFRKVWGLAVEPVD